MASVETLTPGERTSASSVESPKESWKPSAIVADIATLGTGTVLAGLLNVVLVFVVPKLLSIEDYGYWRMFSLYAAYAGLLNLGFTDGALLRWAGQPLEEFHREIRLAMKSLFWQHVFLLVPLGLAASLVLTEQLRFVALAVAGYGLVFNLVTLLQFAFQGARIFRPVAILTVAAPGLFLGLVLIWRWFQTSNSLEVIVLYGLSWLIVLISQLAWIKPWNGARSHMSAVDLAKKCISNGWPIIVANMGAMLILFADRLALSWAATIQNFAQYSLAASAMAVPITAIQACSKVFFSHLAAVTPDGRKRIYGVSSRLLLLAWASFLPYYFALKIVVHHFLPKYVPSLPYARVLLLGIPFLAAVQILQMNFAYLNGIQKRFLLRTALVLVLALAVTSVTAFHAGSLVVLAAAQTAILGAWWLFNEWTLHDLTAQLGNDWVKFLTVYGLISATYWGASLWTDNLAGGVVLYYLGLVIIFATVCNGDLRLLARVMFPAKKELVTQTGWRP